MTRVDIARLEDLWGASGAAAEHSGRRKKYAENCRVSRSDTRHADTMGYVAKVSWVCFEVRRRFRRSPMQDSGLDGCGR